MKKIIINSLFTVVAAVAGFQLGNIKKSQEMREIMIPMLESVLNKDEVDKLQAQEQYLAKQKDNHCSACRTGVFSLWPNGESFCTFCGAKNHYPELLKEEAQ